MQTALHSANGSGWYNLYCVAQYKNDNKKSITLRSSLAPMLSFKRGGSGNGGAGINNGGAVLNNGGDSINNGGADVNNGGAGSKGSKEPRAFRLVGGADAGRITCCIT
eukprot:478039-Rhodomonas_salina.2